jgi:anti-sigma regulatory factor (Ser/Thr protein kinase)
MPTVGTVALDVGWAPCQSGVAVGDLATSVAGRLVRVVGSLARGVAALLRSLVARPLVAVHPGGAGQRGAGGRAATPAGGRRHGIAAVVRHTAPGTATNGASGHVPGPQQPSPADPMRTLVLPADATAPGRARALLRAAADDWGVDGELYHDAAMVVTELVANAVDHARTPSTLTVCREGPDLRLSVRDSRPCSPPRPRPIDPRAARGRGLQMVDALAAAWGVTPHADGKTVWARLGAATSGQEGRPVRTSARATPA